MHNDSRSSSRLINRHIKRIWREHRIRPKRSGSWQLHLWPILRRVTNKWFTTHREDGRTKFAFDFVKNGEDLWFCGGFLAMQSPWLGQDKKKKTEMVQSFALDEINEAVVDKLSARTFSEVNLFRNYTFFHCCLRESFIVMIVQLETLVFSFVMISKFGNRSIYRIRWKSVCCSSRGGNLH